MDKQLEELFNFINGKTFPFGKGITTYPKIDGDQKKLHSALLELEKIGKVERHIEKENYVIWRPIENIESKDLYGRNYGSVYLSTKKFERAC